MTDAYAPTAPMRLVGWGARQVGTSARVGPAIRTWLRWDTATADHLDERVIPGAPELRQVIETICVTARLTTADFGAILDRDRRSVTSWKSGAQQPRAEIVQMITRLQSLIERLQKVNPGFPAAVLSPLYGHPYRSRIVELIRSGDVFEAERLAVTPTADLDLQGREIMTMTVGDYAAAVAERQTAAHALESASDSPETDDDRARMQLLLRSRRMRESKVVTPLS